MMEKPNQTSTRPRSTTLIMAGFLGVLFGLLAVAVSLIVAYRESTPPLTRQGFEAARRKWEQNKPPNYDMIVKVEGLENATYRLAIRGGEVTAACRNERPLTQRRAFETWSVDGMFDAIAADLRHIEESGGKSPNAAPELSLFVVWDERFGYPRQVRRIIERVGREQSWAEKIASPQGAASAGPAEVRWEVVRFAVASPPATPR